jgi:hypothetical protein
MKVATIELQDGFTETVTPTEEWDVTDDAAAMRELWASRLESGEFAQGNGRLHKEYASGKDAEFCVWGVACEIAVEFGLVSRGTVTFDYNGQPQIVGHTYKFPNEIDGWNGEQYTYESETQPGEKVRELFGYNSQASNRLMQANDQGTPFKDLATAIRGYDGEDPLGNLVNIGGVMYNKGGILH